MANAADHEGVSGFVGRVRELAVIRSVLEHARSGATGSVVVSGDAGVGKTRLVERACQESSIADPRTLVLRGTCLPLTSMAVPLLALRGALREVPTALGPPPFAAGSSAGVSDGAPMVFDEWLDRTCVDRPVVLVVDDLQWADQSTLDVLMYVLAGGRHRRLAVLGTVRSGEVGEGHQLHRWLADVRRFPSVLELALGPMDRTETREQLSELLGAPPHETLVSEVFARSGGNAYLTRLLATGLAHDARHLAPDLPHDLREAVLRAWHQLSAPARELVRTMAVGGEVARGPALRRAVELARVDPEESGVLLLREAVDAGMLDLAAGGGYWFHHPLQAEVLEASLPPEERRHLHEAYAKACELDLTHDDADAVSGVSALTVAADHHHRAGHAAQAYSWALRAVDAGAAAGTGGTEQLRLLRRAVHLRDRLAGAPESRADLLERLRSTAMRLGEHQVELDAVQALLDELDPTREPLHVAELLVRREHLRFSTGRAFFTVDEMRRAVTLAEAHPGSWQRALALAEAAQATLWQDDPEAPDLAHRALVAAEAAGHPGALSYAWTANAMVAVFQERQDEALHLARRGVEAAAEAQDWWAFVHASLWECNAIDTPVNPSHARQLQARREQLHALGGAHAYIAWLSGCEASSWLFSGDWESCAQRLRVALGSDPGAAADVITRLVAARLAALQGRQDEAEAHLTRAEELFTETSTFLAFEFDAVRAFVRLGAGDPEGAVEAALTGAMTDGVPPTMCEWLMPLAARGLADLAQAARDAGRSPDHILRRVDDLVRGCPTPSLTRSTRPSTAGCSRDWMPCTPPRSRAHDTRTRRLSTGRVRWRTSNGSCRGRRRMRRGGQRRRSSSRAVVAATRHRRCCAAPTRSLGGSTPHHFGWRSRLSPEPRVSPWTQSPPLSPTSPTRAPCERASPDANERSSTMSWPVGPMARSPVRSSSARRP